MNAASPGTNHAEASPAQALPDAAADRSICSFPSIQLVGLVPAGRSRDLLALADRKLRRIATAYAAGGLVHAAVCTFFFLASFGPEFLQSPGLFMPVFLVMALPVVPTAAYVLSLRPAAIVGWTAAGCSPSSCSPASGRGLALLLRRAAPPDPGARLLPLQSPLLGGASRPLFSPSLRAAASPGCSGCSSAGPWWGRLASDLVVPARRVRARRRPRALCRAPDRLALPRQGHERSGTFPRRLVGRIHGDPGGDVHDPGGECAHAGEPRRLPCRTI